MTMKQVREILEGIARAQGNVNNAITFEEGRYFNLLTIHVEDFIGFTDEWDEKFQDFSEGTVLMIIEWLDEWCDEKGARWSGGRWNFDGFKVVLEYSHEDI